MSTGTLLLLILVILLIGALPSWPYSAGWGYYPVGGLGTILIIVLIGAFGLASAVTVYFRRRMNNDLMRPVASMHESVLKLEAGEYDHRIEVARRDELGELAEAFNRMSGALHDSYRELTVRASHDSLTGLANRASLTERLAASFNQGTDRSKVSGSHTCSSMLASVPAVSGRKVPTSNILQPIAPSCCRTAVVLSLDVIAPPHPAARDANR